MFYIKGNVRFSCLLHISSETLYIPTRLSVAGTNVVVFPQERREREQQELESAKEMADEDFDGFA